MRSSRQVSPSPPGVDALKALDSLSYLKGASGRLELVGTHPSGAQIYVDYAHTPDAIANALKALRPHTRNKLIIVFGAGGDRDPGKRALMGQAAEGNADRLIVTDDNPRNEDPASIRKAVLGGAPDAEEIPDRRTAIQSAVYGLKEGDILLIAGKGHETGQTIGEKVLPFSDQDEARQALKSVGGASVSFLWMTEDFVAASGGRLHGEPPAARHWRLDRQPLHRTGRGLRRHSRREPRRARVRGAGAEGRCGVGDRGGGEGIDIGAARFLSCATTRSQRWSGSARRRARACTVR